mmetsp:Transcript_9290/g.34050  ORF Transcript_9290/g.34050 Transcript_9290/m.34050 type:complete len:123 (-) Transcript_9290:284-652(-)
MSINSFLSSSFLLLCVALVVQASNEPVQCRTECQACYELAYQQGHNDCMADVAGNAVDAEAPPEGDTTVVTNTVATVNVNVDDSVAVGEGMSIGDGVDVENGFHIGDGIDSRVDASGSRKLK